MSTLSHANVRAGTRGSVETRDRILCALIAVIAVFGDALKWLIASDAALYGIYSAAAALLIGIAAFTPGRLLGKYEQVTSAFILVVIATYLVQVPLSHDPALAVKHAIYMIMPLMYLVVMLRCWPTFDVRLLANTFLVLMIPVNVVGFVQYFVDPSFLILTTYSTEFDSVIVRNLLDGGAFSRYPSMYASADRYSAMALMQLYYAFILLWSERSPSYGKLAWVVGNVIVAALALLISGARSRILIAGFEITLLLGVYLLTGNQAHPIRNRMIAAVAAAAVIVLSILVLRGHEASPDDASFPVVEFLRQSVEHDDIPVRLEEAVIASQVSDRVSAFGEGLGSVGQGGRPGEFGIMSMWIESGIFWSTFLLFGFAGLILVLCRIAMTAFAQGRPVAAFVHTLPIAVIILALLAGLTSAFELSSGIMLACGIAAAVRSTQASVCGGSAGPDRRRPVAPQVL